MGKYISNYPPPNAAYLQDIRNPFHNVQHNSPMGMLPPPSFHSHMMHQPRLPLGSLQPNVAANSPVRVFGEKPLQNTTNNGKRPYSAITPDQSYTASSNQVEIPDDDPRLTHITDDCDRVRYRIYMFLAESGMKMSDFIRTIGSTYRSYHAFMDQSGPREGRNSNVYRQAFAFFKRRELGAATPIPAKKPKTSSSSSTPASTSATSHPEADSTSTQPAKKQKQSKSTADKDASNPYEGIENITLDGEETDNVPVFSTCDDIRRMISAHLRCKNVTQAGFLRAVSAQFKVHDRTIQGAQLKRFRDYKGPTTGNSSGVFYGAYVLFEKMRIRDGKPKSEKREGMERVWGHRGGFDREPSHNTGYLCSADYEIVMDEFGIVTSRKIGSRW